MTQHVSHNEAARPASEDGLSAWNSPTVTALGQASESWVKAYADWQQEVARFIGARLTENQRTQEAFASCKNFADALKVQQEWAFNAAKEYTEEAARLAQVVCTLQPGAVEGEKPPQAPPSTASSTPRKLSR